MTKLIAFDLDDTLLREDLSISPYSVEVFSRLRDRGMEIVPASGRARMSMQPFVDQIRCVSWFIACNGAEIWDARRSTLLCQETFPAELGREIAAFGERYQVYAQTYEGSCFYYNEPSFWAKRYAVSSRLTGVQVGPLSEYIREPRHKILMMAEEDKIREMLQEAREQFDGRVSVTCSKPYFLEFNPIRATKGIALRTLADHLKIRMEDTLAFGDSLNDLSMLQAAGRSVAVANAWEEIRSRCDDVCGSNQEDGVARYLEEHFLSGEANR